MTGVWWAGLGACTPGLPVDLTLEGPVGSGFGTELTVLGDVDGDGVMDLALAGRAGRPVVLQRGPLLPESVLQRATLMEPEGAALDALTLPGGPHAVGDVDGDGLSDLVIGEPGAFDGAGAAWLFLSPIESLDRDRAHTVWRGTSPGQGVGVVVGIGRDLAGDVSGDVVIGSLVPPRVFVEPGTPAGEIAVDASPSAVVWLDAPATALLIADLDDDDQGDLIVDGLWLPGPVAGVLSATDGVQTGARHAIAAGDFDRNRVTDLALVFEDRVEIWTGPVRAGMRPSHVLEHPAGLGGARGDFGWVGGVEEPGLFLGVPGLGVYFVSDLDPSSVTLDGSRRIYGVPGELPRVVDVNGDGVDDLVVGDPGYVADRCEEGCLPQGAVHVRYGVPSD